MKTLLIIILGCWSLSSVAQSTSADPVGPCLDRFLSSDTFAPLRTKLPMSGQFSAEDLTNSDLPTAVERKAVSDLVMEFQSCHRLGESWRNNNFPPGAMTLIADENTQTLLLLVDLFDGHMTYGQYNRKRLLLNQEVTRKMGAFIDDLKVSV
jgi:hypothetical protein